MYNLYLQAFMVAALGEGRDRMWDDADRSLVAINLGLADGIEQRSATPIARGFGLPFRSREDVERIVDDVAGKVPPLPPRDEPGMLADVASIEDLRILGVLASYEMVESWPCPRPAVIHAIEQRRVELLKLQYLAAQSQTQQAKAQA